MASDTYERIMDHVFEFEGGFANHPDDPGGATNMGITIGTLKAYRGKAVTKDDVKAMTKTEAREIYRKNYWNKVRGNDLPAGIDAMVMDAAVNSGPSRSAQWLQEVVGVSQDGVIGPQTIAAVKALPSVVVVNLLYDRRMRFLRGLGTWDTFGKGWSRRVDSLKKLATDMALTGPTMQPSQDTSEPPAKPPRTRAVIIAEIRDRLAELEQTGA